MYDVPEHFPIGVNAQGQGPVMEWEPDWVAEVCWCGRAGCEEYR